MKLPERPVIDFLFFFLQGTKKFSIFLKKYFLLVVEKVSFLDQEMGERYEEISDCFGSLQTIYECNQRRLHSAECGILDYRKEKAFCLENPFPDFSCLEMLSACLALQNFKFQLPGFSKLCKGDGDEISILESVLFVVVVCHGTFDS